MAHATTQKRNSKEQDINVNFSNNLQGTLVGKTVNGKTPYRYIYDTAGNIVEEIRYDLKVSDGSYINQHYIYSDNGYTVKRTAWSPNNTTGKTVEIDHYADVDGKKALLSQWTPDATIATDYDYNLGKPLSIQQTPNNDAAAKTDPSSKTTYQYDDTADNSGQVSGHLLSQRNNKGQTIRYRYYSPQDKTLPDGLKSRTVFIGNPQNGTPLTGIETTYHKTQTFNSRTISADTQIDQVTPSSTLATEPVLIQTLVSLTTQKDAQGNITKEDRKNSKGVTTDQKLITYDNYNRPVQILFKMVSNTANDTLIGGINYTYKQANNSTRQLSSQTEYSKQDDKQIKTDYRYDNGNRLADVRRLDTNYGAISNDGDFTKSTETTNTYDAMSNLQDRYIIPGNTMGDGRYKHYHYVYDGYNQLQRTESNDLTTQTISWDINGNMTSDEYGTKRKFDKENHEVDTIVNAPQGKTSTIDVHNQWANGLRLTQRVQGTTFHYQYLNGQLLDTQVQTTGKDTTQNGWFSVYATPTIRVITTQDGQIKDIQDSDTGSDHSVYCARQTAQDKAVSAKQNTLYHYDADGNLVAPPAQQTSTLDILQPTKLFHGGLHDLITQEDYRRVRFVTTHRGGMRQFTSRDFGKKLVNLDEFANEDAVVYRDPSGHAPYAEELLKIMKEAAAVPLPEEGLLEKVVTTLVDDDGLKELTQAGKNAIDDIKSYNKFSPTYMRTDGTIDPIWGSRANPGRYCAEPPSPYSPDDECDNALFAYYYLLNTGDYSQINELNFAGMKQEIADGFAANCSLQSIMVRQHLINAGYDAKLLEIVDAENNMHTTVLLNNKLIIDSWHGYKDKEITLFDEQNVKKNYPWASFWGNSFLADLEKLKLAT